MPDLPASLTPDVRDLAEVGPMERPERLVIAIAASTLAIYVVVDEPAFAVVASALLVVVLVGLAMDRRSK